MAPHKLEDTLYNSILDKLQKAFPKSFVYYNGEYITHKEANSYFNLADCETELDVRCKILEYLSSHAYKTQPYHTKAANLKYHDFMLHGINSYLNTAFTSENIELIYTYLGNRVNHDLTVQFVESGYNLKILEDIRQTEREKYLTAAKQRQVVYDYVDKQKESELYPFKKKDVTWNDAMKIINRCNGVLEEQNLFNACSAILGRAEIKEYISSENINVKSQPILDR